jgi:hypothetical protein
MASVASRTTIGPSEQLTPTAEAPSSFMRRATSPAVVPSDMRPCSSTLADAMTGIRPPAASTAASTATTSSFVCRNVSTTMASTPPSASARACSTTAARTLARSAALASPRK